MVFRELNRGWGTAIYSRNIPFDEIPLCEKYPGHAVGVAASLQNGERLYLASIHGYPDLAFPRLAHIMAEILETFAGRSMIVGGDLNTARLAETVWPGRGHRQFWERIDNPGGNLIDCCHRINGREIQTIFRKGSVHPFQDDHLFISRDLGSRLETCDVIDTQVTRTVSDHIPLYMELGV